MSCKIISENPIIPNPYPSLKPRKLFSLKPPTERFSKHHVTSIDYYWKQAQELPDPGQYFQGLEYSATTPSFSLNTCDWRRFPECVIDKNSKGPILECLDMETNVGDRKHLDCIRPRANTGVIIAKSKHNAHDMGPLLPRNQTPGPAAYHPDDTLTRNNLGGVLPRGKRNMVFDMPDQSHLSTFDPGDDYLDASSYRPKARGPSVTFSRAHVNRDRHDVYDPTKPKINRDSAGPIYKPCETFVRPHCRTAKIGTERRYWVTSLQSEMFTKLDDPSRYRQLRKCKAAFAAAAARHFKKNS